MQYNSEEYEEILNIFKAESEEIISSLNDNFLRLEKNPEDKTPLKKLFQLAHSLKGSARMLGFNSIQDLAHKIEDILSNWKNDDVIIKSEYFEVIYDVCDFLTELIENSVKRKSDYHTGQVVIFLNKLDEFLTKNNIVDLNQNKENVVEFISSKMMDINATILELLFILERDSQSDIEEVLLVVNENLTTLSEIFSKTSFMDIRKKIASLLTYLENNKDLEYLKKEIPELRQDIYNIYKEMDIKSAVYKTEYKTNNEKKEENKENTPHKILKEKFDVVLFNLQKIKFDKKYIDEVIKDLKTFISYTNNNKIKLILSKTVNILNIFKTENAVLDNDCYMVILQSVYLIRNMLVNEKEENTSNINFVIQRLSVVEDMFSSVQLKVPENVKSAVKHTSKEIQTQDYEDLKNNVKSFDLGEIRTLRVDTQKLDNLISQTGELLINGIKTGEHIAELSNISTKIHKWNSESKKIINYLKYMEKKGLFNNNSTDSVISSFYKKTQNFISSNAHTINEISNDITNLYNIIFEDDNKLNQNVIEIEAIAKGIRVLPLASIFHSFPRMIRDIAKENNKKINFVITGSDTTVDKKIIEEIKMPLVHLLRNSVSHGIETPENRKKNNKNETGLIKLTAKQVENNVVITIEDDGYGINLERVKDIAIEKGLLTEEEIENISDEKLMKLLFIPGFSTKDSINEISGRGIGLDVVKTKITNLNGDISIDSVLNKGCRVTIKLPLSMSTIKTLVFSADKQKFAIPVNSIKYVQKIKKEDILKRNNQNYIIYDNQSVPIFYLSKILGYTVNEENIDDEKTIVILESQDTKSAFIADKLLGDQEVFQKKLMAPILKIKNISGFTTLSTGEVCFIINTNELIKNTIENKKEQTLLIDYSGPTENKNIIIYDNNYIIKNNSNLKNVFFFDSIASIYDYIQNNKSDLIICEYDTEDKQLLHLLKYIKTDENYNKIKIVLLTNLNEYEVMKQLDDLKPDLIININKYNSQEIFTSAMNLFKN